MGGISPFSPHNRQIKCGFQVQRASTRLADRAGAGRAHDLSGEQHRIIGLFSIYAHSTKLPSYSHSLHIAFVIESVRLLVSNGPGSRTELFSGTVPTSSLIPADRGGARVARRLPVASPLARGQRLRWIDEQRRDRRRQGPV